jgi:hypothetical protein
MNQGRWSIVTDGVRHHVTSKLMRMFDDAHTGEVFLPLLPAPVAAMPDAYVGVHTLPPGSRMLEAKF